MPIQPRNSVERALFAELREICGSGTWEMHNGGAGQPSRGFKVVDRDDRIRVIHQDATKVSWSRDALIVTVSAKLRNTVLVAGRVSRKGDRRFVIFKDVRLLADFKPSEFMTGLGEGWIAVDFDAREQSPGSKGFRNHCTKFRVKHQDMHRLIDRVEELI